MRIHVAMIRDEDATGPAAYYITVQAFASRRAATKWYDETLMRAFREGRNMSGCGIRRVTVKE